LSGTFDNGAVPPALIAAIRYVTESPGESVVSEYDVVAASPKLVSIVSIVPPLRFLRITYPVIGEPLSTGVVHDKST